MKLRTIIGLLLIVAGGWKLANMWNIVDNDWLWSQPWTVYGLLRTSDSVSPIALSNMALTMTVFVVVYVIVFGSGIGILGRLLARAPQEGEHETSPSHAPNILATSTHPKVINPSSGEGA